MKRIASRQNPVIKHVKALERKKYRRHHREAVLEGRRIIADALESEVRFSRVLLDEAADERAVELAVLLESDGAEAAFVETGLFNLLSETVHSQGILAVAELPQAPPDAVFEEESGFWVLLDRLQDPGNLGTIIRTADAAGASGIALTAGCVDVYNSKVLRSAMGSVFHLPILQDLPGKTFLGGLKKAGFRLFAADLSGALSFERASYPDKTCLVIGNEGAGIRRELLDICDESVKIPIIGRAESLNAAVAAGILLYDIAMKRKSSGN